MRCVKLAGEIEASLVNERRAERVSVSKGDNLIPKIEGHLSSQPDSACRECGPSPRHTVIGVLARIEEPFAEESTFLTQLMINLQGNVCLVLAAAEGCPIIAADSGSPSCRQRTTAQ